MRLRKIIPWLVLGLGTVLGAAERHSDQPCSISSGESGNLLFSNSVMDVTASPQYGRTSGITGWRFKLNSQDMIDRNREHKNILGENWDSLEYKSAPAGYMIGNGQVYAPLARGVSADGSAAGIIQEVRQSYAVKRTTVIRRDYSLLKITWSCTNINGAPAGGAFRFFSAMFPGALTGTSLKSTDIVMPTEKGLVYLDQNIRGTAFKEKFGGERFFLKRWADKERMEPRRWWTENVLPTPFLNDCWSAEVNRNNGNGVLFIADRKTLIGYYNSPGETLEAVMEAIALQPGESWTTSVSAGIFQIPKEEKLTGTNELFVTTENGIVPLFIGEIEIDGKKYKASPVEFIRMPPASMKNIKGFDTAGKQLGSWLDGTCVMSPENIEYKVPEKPWFFGKVYNPDADAVAGFLKEGNFTVYCGAENRDDVREKAKNIALRLGVGLADINPKGRIIAIGAADRDELVRSIGLMQNSVTGEWPGAGFGAVRAFGRIDLTDCPAVVVAGSDTEGVLRTLDKFENRFMDEYIQPKGFSAVVVSAARPVYPFSRPDRDSTDRIVVTGAKGEYESAQILFSALSAQKDIKFSLGEFVNKATGEKLSKNYSTPHRRAFGPVRIRFVDYSHYEHKPGTIYYPDPLMDRKVTALSAGDAMGVWLTFIIPDIAAAGTYFNTLTVSTSDGRKEIPVELNILDFQIPKDGMIGEGYTQMDYFQPLDSYNERKIISFVTNMVEHGIRLIHLPNGGLYNVRTDKDGKFKGLSTEHIESSEDGILSVDFTEFDRIKELCDKAGTPFKLIYLSNMMPLDMQRRIAWFQREFPKRHPEREGNKALNSPYLEEVLKLFKKHLDKKGWTNDIYLKVGDEPHDIKWWYESLSQAAAGSGMKFYTAHGSAGLENADPAWSDIWQPIYASYNEAFMEKARKAGKLVSFYNCGPPPQTGLRAGASEWRSYLWQAAKYDLDIVAWWGVQCWSYHMKNGVWRSNSQWDSIVYPEHPVKDRFRDGARECDADIIDSIRWEIIRDGMEDAWYFNLLRREIANAKKNGFTKEAAEAEAVIANVWKEVYPTRNQYHPEYQVILDRRMQIAEQILKLQKLSVKK